MSVCQKPVLTLMNLSVLQGELEPEEHEGHAVTEKLSEITKTKSSELTDIEGEMSKYPVPQNCPNLKAPTRHKELTDKGYLDMSARWINTRVLNGQGMLLCAMVAMISAADKLHTLASELTM